MKARIIEINKESDAIERIKDTGADLSSLKLMSSKTLFRNILLEKIDNRAANLIKQEILSLGGDAAVNWQVSRFSKGVSDVLLMATEKQLNSLIKKFEKQPFGLKLLAKEIGAVILNYKKEEFRSGGINISRQGPLVMGILNVTPDSFSDGDIYFDVETALEHGLDMVKEGAGIIDIGGQSTRPGSKPVSAKEEIRRIVPVIKKLAKKIRIPISVDTYKPEVAQAAIDSGVRMINDITGLRYKNGLMAKVAARNKLPVIIMHMQGNPSNMQDNPKYNDVVADIADFFDKRIDFAVESGIKSDNILLDPGIGFGKTPDHNLQILKRLREFTSFGKPLVVGTSLKAFIGKILGGIPAGERLSGSLASFVWASLNGAGILRVHNVKEAVQALKVIKAINELQTK
ncbi:MAG: dihydropteroate synthase [Elusimicrobia bacterium]|nr:dihydropteroate synthase [Candidatus Liberimonas magnetica]